MSGLEQILLEIQNEAEEESRAAVNQAKAKAEEILSEAKAKSDAQTAKLDANAAREVAEIERRRDSARELQKRQRTLQTKQMLLSETLEKALESLYVLPDVQYFVLLVKLAAGNAQPGEGEMLLNKKDLARLPADFETHLAGALPAGAKLTVAKESRPIDGGFVLKYGDIEENCSFRDLFAARRDEFFDLIRDTLFA